MNDLLGPNGRSLPKRDRFAARLLGLRERPSISLLGAALAMLLPGGLIGSCVERWYLQPKREAEAAAEAKRAEQQAAIREGRYYAPRASLLWNGDGCILANRDVLPVVEATIAWRYYIVDQRGAFVRAEMRQGHDRPAAASRELRPREQLLGPLGDLPRRVCDERRVEWSCPAAECPITILECEARFARESDRALFALSEAAFIDEDCKPHAIGEARDLSTVADTWKDDRVRIAVEAVEASKRDPRGQHFRDFSESLRETPAPVPRGE